MKSAITQQPTPLPTPADPGAELPSAVMVSSILAKPAMMEMNLMVMDALVSAKGNVVTDVLTPEKFVTMDPETQTLFLAAAEATVSFLDVVMESLMLGRNVMMDLLPDMPPMDADLTVLSLDVVMVSLITFTVKLVTKEAATP
jgi:hypothetical protein